MEMDAQMNLTTSVASGTSYKRKTCRYFVMSARINQMTDNVHNICYSKHNQYKPFPTIIGFNYEIFF